MIRLHSDFRPGTAHCASRRRALSIVPQCSALQLWHPDIYKCFKLKLITMQHKRPLCAIVEPRNHCALLDAVHNVSSAVDCDVVLFHGRQNRELALAVQERSSADRIRLEQIEVDNLSAEDYSDVLMSAPFWNTIAKQAGDKNDDVLIFQTDSGVCWSADDRRIPDMLAVLAENEYCGAPWPKPGDHVGNGGFSYRNIAASQRALREAEVVPQGQDVPEDVFFSSALSVCPRDTALSFSAETTWRSQTPFGFHAWWKYAGSGVREASCPQSGINQFLGYLNTTHAEALTAFRSAAQSEQDGSHS